MGIFGKADTPIKCVFFNLDASPIKFEFGNAMVDLQDNRFIILSGTITNNSNEILDAASIGVDMLSVFNEYMEHFGCYTKEDIKPGKSAKVSWKVHPWEAGLVGSVIGYSYKTRLKDGTVWIGDAESVQNKIDEAFSIKIDVVEEAKKAKNKRK